MKTSTPANDMLRGAVLSSCGQYRYHLLRRWDPSRQTLVFVMLNPSTADATIDDPTIRRCIGFGRNLGYGGIEVVNLFAFRTASPAVLKASGYPIGPDNDAMLGRIATGVLLGACDVCAAWGSNAGSAARAASVRRLFATAGVTLHYLRLTSGGHPGHLLYLPSDLKPQPWALDESKGTV